MKKENINKFFKKYGANFIGFIAIVGVPIFLPIIQNLFTKFVDYHLAFQITFILTVIFEYGIVKTFREIDDELIKNDKVKKGSFKEMYYYSCKYYKGVLLGLLLLALIVLTQSLLCEIGIIKSEITTTPYEYPCTYENVVDYEDIEDYKLSDFCACENCTNK